MSLLKLACVWGREKEVSINLNEVHIHRHAALPTASCMYKRRGAIDHWLYYV